MTAGYKILLWLRDIPLWYWGWCTSSITGALALMMPYPINTYLLIASILCSLVLITNHVLYKLIANAKNSKLF